MDDINCFEYKINKLIKKCEENEYLSLIFLKFIALFSDDCKNICQKNRMCAIFDKKSIDEMQKIYSFFKNSKYPENNKKFGLDDLYRLFIIDPKNARNIIKKYINIINVYISIDPVKKYNILKDFNYNLHIKD